ncbi:MAG: purine-nucleoside phosphorylase, partial [Gemmataceae bacterium]
SGPSYETPAEIVALRRAGADAVGMSTVPEALEAAGLGMEVGAVSLITNKAAGLGGAVDHADVLAVARASGERLADRLEAVIAHLG